MSGKKLIHLLRPKEFRVWCLGQERSPKDLDLTTKPSMATCANCLTIFRRHNTGNRKRYRVSHVAPTRKAWWEDPERNPWWEDPERNPWYDED